MSKMYRLDFHKAGSEENLKAAATSVTRRRRGHGYHPYHDGSRNFRFDRPLPENSPWPFSVTFDVLLAGNQQQGNGFGRKNRAANLEKQRQSRINEGIHRLREVLPKDYVLGERMTKAKTLRFAAAYIHELTMILQFGTPQGIGRCMTSPSQYYPGDSPFPGWHQPFSSYASQPTQSPHDYQQYHQGPISPPQTSPYYAAPSPGPYANYQGPPSDRGTPPLGALRPLCTSSPIYPRQPGPSAPVRPHCGALQMYFPEMARAFDATDLAQQQEYSCTSSQWNPRSLAAHWPRPYPRSPCSPCLSSPQPSESEIITVDSDGEGS